MKNFLIDNFQLLFTFPATEYNLQMLCSKHKAHILMLFCFFILLITVIELKNFRSKRIPRVIKYEKNYFESIYKYYLSTVTVEMVIHFEKFSCLRLVLLITNEKNHHNDYIWLSS